MRWRDRDRPRGTAAQATSREALRRSMSCNSPWRDNVTARELGVGSPDLPLRVEGLVVGAAVPDEADRAGGGPAAEGGGDAPRLDAMAQLRAPALLDLLDEHRGPENLVRGLALDHEAHHF